MAQVATKVTGPAWDGNTMEDAMAVQSGDVAARAVTRAGSAARVAVDDLSPSGGGDFPPNVDNLSNHIVSFIESKGVERLVIDSTMLLEYYFSDNFDAMIKFLTALKRADATVLLISEMTDPSSYSDGHYLAHGVVFLHNYLESGEMTRGVQIIKMRGTEIDCDIREIAFSGSGLRVYPDRKVQA